MMLAHVTHFDFPALLLFGTACLLVGASLALALVRSPRNHADAD